MHGRQTLPPVDMNRIHPANQTPNIKFRDTVVVFFFFLLICYIFVEEASHRSQTDVFISYIQPQ